MACGFTDCLTYLLGGALVGTAVGIGGTYFLSGKRGAERVAKVRQKLGLKEREVEATAGLAGGRRRRQRDLGGCACGG